MSNEQKIIDKIMADAEREKNIILDKAQSEADATIRKANEQAAKELEQAAILAEAEAEKAVAKVISSAEMEAKKMILAQKQSCLEQTLELVKEKLHAQSAEEYEKTILSMLAKAEKGEEIIFSEKDRKALQKAVSEAGYTVSEETRDISGGFIVKKGDIEFNYSFEAMMAVEKEQIEQMIAEILFE